MIETEADRRAILVADSFGGEPFTCTMLGESLYRDSIAAASRNRQCYARPAGRVLRRLEKMGYVERNYTWVSVLSKMTRDPKSKRDCWRRTRKSIPA